MTPPPKHTSDFDVRDTVRFREEIWAMLGKLEGGQEAMKEMCASRKVECGKMFAELFEKSSANAQGVQEVKIERATYHGMLKAAFPIVMKAVGIGLIIFLSFLVGGREVASEAAKQVIKQIEADYDLPAKGPKADTGELGKEGP